ncbi:MAG: transposase [Bacteriovorax sp.]|nr:transposase [Bacteriovorax sp.]
MIAQSDIVFSNSMIEAIFKKLKSVINFQSIKTSKGLNRKIQWFVGQYNNHVPHSQLKGASPKEQLEMSFDRNDFDLTVRKARLRLTGERSADFQRCRSCF